MITADDFPHGTRTGYKYGCRCDDCRRPHTEYMRAYRDAQAAINPVEPWERPADLSWMDSAECRDHPTRLFFANNARRPYSRTTLEAIAICERCDVRIDCLEYALNLPAPWHGIYAGLNVGERIAIYKTRHNRRP